MTSGYYSHRRGDYVFDVTVTKDDTIRLSHRYRAHLRNAERIEYGRLAPVQVLGGIRDRDQIVLGRCRHRSLLRAHGVSPDAR